MIKIIIRSLVYITFGLVIVFLIFGWWTAKQAHHYQTELGPELRQLYGFSTGTPIVKAGDEYIEVLTIYPEKGGVIEKAGFKNGDIILSTTLTGFYQALHQKSYPISYNVVNGGDGIAMAKRTRRTVTISD
jgi:hypothetical protein